MPSVEFLCPRLIGARFENGEIPLEFLRDLAALRELVLDVAKWRFLAENPERARVPRGFTDKVQLKLTGLRKGSATSIISLSVEAPILFGDALPYKAYFEQAAQCIINAVKSALTAGTEPTVGLKDPLPHKYLAHFDPIGRSLREGETLELGLPAGRSAVQLDQSGRRKMLARSQVRELTQAVRLRGGISEVDLDRMTFELHPIYGRKVSCPMLAQQIDAVMEGLNGYRDEIKVFVQGIGRYDQQDRMQGIASIEQINVLDPLDIPARLDEFRSMDDGWLEGEGLAPSPDGLDWLSCQCERYFEDDLPLPHVYPTPEGGVEAEWSLEFRSAILAVDLTDHQGHWHEFGNDSDQDETEQGLDLDRNEDWVWLMSQIRRMAEKSE